MSMCQVLFLVSLFGLCLSLSIFSVHAHVLCRLGGQLQIRDGNIEKVLAIIATYVVATAKGDTEKHFLRMVEQQIATVTQRERE